MGTVSVMVISAGALVEERRRAEQEHEELLVRAQAARAEAEADRKSTRLNSSHSQISYAVFCLKKKYNDFVPLEAAVMLLSSHQQHFLSIRSWNCRWQVLHSSVCLPHYNVPSPPFTTPSFLVFS